MGSSRLLFINGVVSDAPPVTSFLETHPGAYTTTRTHNDASCILFWEKHVQRLANSARILCNSRPEFFFKFGEANILKDSSFWELTIQSLVNDSISRALPVAFNERRSGEELAITALVSGNVEKMEANGVGDEEGFASALDVYVHIAPYVPHAFGARDNVAHLAVVGRGREVAAAKYSNWVRLRKPLEKLRPTSSTELLLSNDGDQILEGCVTNFFVVCRVNHAQDNDSHLDDFNTHNFEVQTAPLQDGVLPGVIRQIVIEICCCKGIPLQEVAPQWSSRQRWEEAFITSSLRLLQHVETVRAPTLWESLESKTWRHVAWEEKKFKEGPGMITMIIQEEILKKADLEGFSASAFA